jgi:hypothetical protein
MASAPHKQLRLDHKQLVTVLTVMRSYFPQSLWNSTVDMLEPSCLTKHTYRCVKSVLSKDQMLIKQRIWDGMLLLAIKYVTQ